MITNQEIPHRLQLGAQLVYLKGIGHGPEDGEITTDGLTAYLERLHSEGAIHLVDSASCSDAQFLRAQLKAAEDAGRLFVQAPTPEQGGPTVKRDPAKAAYTLTRAEANDVEKYRAAKAKAVEADANGGFPIIIG